MDIWDTIENTKVDEYDQSYISRKPDEKINDFSVNRALVNSISYKEKFDQIEIPKPVQQSLHKQACRLLEFVDGQPNEYMIAIDARTGTFLADNMGRKGNMYHTGFITQESRKVLECPNQVITMHNHSLNGRPSAQDLIAFLHQEKVDHSLVLCHDGTIYDIDFVSPKFEEYYKGQLDLKQQLVENIEIAKNIAMTNAAQYNDNCRLKHKLFSIRRL